MKNMQIQLSPHVDSAYSGFTLIEMVVGLFASTILLSGLFLLLSTSQSNQVSLVSSYLSVDAVNGNITNMIRTIRTAQPSANGSYLIESATSNEFILFSDIDGDDIVERVRYRRTGNTLERGVTEPTGVPATYPPAMEKFTVLADGISNGSVPVFSYYNAGWPVDQAGNPLPAPVDRARIRLVRLHIASHVDAQENTAYMLDTYVALRMLKSN